MNYNDNFATCFPNGFPPSKVSPIHCPPTVLATDLDGTLFPIDDSPAYSDAMRTLKSLINQHQLSVVFVTGRSFDHVMRGIDEHSPPIPEAIICDVGTTIMRRRDDAFDRDDRYHAMLLGRLGDWTHAALETAVQELDDTIHPQDAVHQSELKCSFYYPAERRAAVTQTVQRWIDSQSVPVSMTISVDPFDGRGMLDLLPAGADKGSALRYWVEHRGIDAGGVVFAGDTGNDIGAATTAASVILPANADDQLRDAVSDRAGELVESSLRCTAGVLDGLQRLLGRGQTI